MIQEHARENDFPVAATYRLESIYLISFPVIELTDDVYFCGIRSPFTEYPIAFIVTMKTIEHVVIHSLAQEAVNRHSFLHFKERFMSSVNDILIWEQPLVMIIDHRILYFFFLHIYGWLLVS